MVEKWHYLAIPHNGFMIELGRTQTLVVARLTSVGAFLTDGATDVLLPKKYVHEATVPDDQLEVFVYADSEDRLVATTRRPKAQVGEFAAMRVVDLAAAGAFVDWGLEKDLLVPFANQNHRLSERDTAVVWVMRDDVSRRIVGSTKYRRFLVPEANGLAQAQTVSLVLLEPLRDGMAVAIDGKYHGMLFADEIHSRLMVGQTMPGFVKRIREDGRISVSLSPQGQAAIEGEGPRLLARLDREGGFLPFSDTTDPEIIRREFSMSKASFKRLIGSLMRNGEITIEHHGIRRKAD